MIGANNYCIDLGIKLILLKVTITHISTIRESFFVICSPTSYPDKFKFFLNTYCSDDVSFFNVSFLSNIFGCSVAGTVYLLRHNLVKTKLPNLLSILNPCSPR